MIDWVMRQTILDRPWGIRWALFSTLKDLDFADDLALVSHTHQHMHEKITHLRMFAQQIGLKISQEKTEMMMLNVPNSSPVKVNEEELPTTEDFGSTARLYGGAGSNIRNCLNKARNAFRMLNNAWKSSQYNTKTKLRLYPSYVLSTLLHRRLRMLEDD